MSRDKIPPDVLELAKTQLVPGFASRYPATYRAYCEELHKHLQLYPRDSHFCVQLDPGRNVGVVTCLEAGCKNEKIPLAKRLTVKDGGLAVGVGSLSSYRAHIASNKEHVNARNARTRAGSTESKPSMSAKSSPSTSGVRRSALLDALDGNVDSSSSPSKPAPRAVDNAQARRLLARSSSGLQGPSVKAEPVEPAIPKKRPSDTPARIKKEDSFEALTSGLSTPNAKRVKSEHSMDSLKTPLGVVNRTPSFDDVKPTVPRAAMNQDKVEETRSRMAEVQRQIAHLQAALDKAQRKRVKMKADLTRIARLERELKELHARKDAYSASLPSVASTISRLPSLNQPAPPAASGSNVQLPPAFHNPAFSAQQQRTVVVNQPVAQQNVAVLRNEQFVQRNAPIPSGSNVRLDAQAIVKAEVGDPALDPNQGDPRFDFGAVTRDVAGIRRHMTDDQRFDEEGNFFGRGRDDFIGPMAKADDIDKFLIEAGNAEQFDGNANVEEALQKLGLPGLFQPLPGMTVALMPHQAIGVAWMLDKEHSNDRGGCMADEMGLGKTVQMIAVIASNRSANPLKKSTLIVAPLALLDQWQAEIEDKTDLGLKSLVYHGNNKVRSPEQLRQYDIVLTTFHTLANEWPDDEAAERAEKEKAKKKRKKMANNDWIVNDESEEEKPFKRRGRKTSGPLFLLDWYRIVLDEAQNIRNRRTRVSRAVTTLDAQYRWCLTGTPIINCLADAYGLIRFLRIRPFYDWTNFNTDIARLEKKQPALATDRLQAIFKKMLLRRKKDSMLDGKALIDLPQKDVVLHKLQFTKEERDIYQMVETRSQAMFNKFLRAGTVLKNYTQVLVLLLRLRQICSHPSLIQEGGAAYLEIAEDGPDGKERELARAEKLLGKDFVKRMKDKFRKAMLDRVAAEKASADAALEGEDVECSICLDNYTDAVVTACGHCFCRECVLNVVNGPQREDADEPTRYKPHERPCPACRGPISQEKIFSRAVFEPADDEINGKGVKAEEEDGDSDIIMIDDEAEVKKPGRLLRKRKASAIRVLDSDDEAEDGDDDGMSDFIVESDEDEEEKDARRALKRRLKGKQRAIVISDDEDDDIIFGARPDKPLNGQPIKLMEKFLPSTKMKHMMESLKQWAEEYPDEKTLIISQWTQCLQLVSDYLTENGIVHVKYQGGMSRPMRERAIRAFMAKDKATVMLMSLKCGGVGLNLTRANRVINLDLGWSLAVEQQAYDRVHRLGQTRPVTVNRLVIADTVEDRILALQERKKNLAEGSLGEGAGKKLGRLSVKELANLFGLDHRGNLLA